MQRRLGMLALRLADLVVFSLSPLPNQTLLELSAQDPADRDPTAWNARSISILLLNRYPEATDEASRAALRDAVATYDLGWAAIAQVYNERSSIGPEKARDGLLNTAS